MDFLHLSRQLGQTLSLTKQLLGLSAFRFHLIVQTSERGEGCPHAQMCRRHALTEQDELIEILHNLHSLTGQLLQELEASPMVDLQEE